MDWRNDAQTLAMSFHQEPKTWANFWPEFRDSYFAEPDLAPVFLLEDGHRVAFLRFRPAQHPEGLAGRCVDISINVAPNARGRGLGQRALRTVSHHILSSAGVDSVVAEVRVGNAASLSCFPAAGFQDAGRAEKLIPDTGERCEIIRFVNELTSPRWRHGKVFLIAEAGSNWRMGTPARDDSMGKALIDAAIAAGADAVKFQTYRPETVYVENAGTSDYLSDSGYRQDIREIFADLAMSDDLVTSLAAYCRERDIAFMSTPFSPRDFAAVDPHVAIHKVASYEISHPHLLTLAAKSGKPLLLSTGASSEADIAWAVETVRAAGGRDICLMQCTARYPAPPESLNLRSIPWLKRRFGVSAGFSDHSRDPLEGPLAAVALGARVVEKHYTLDRRLPGPDHAFAITPAELKDMVDGIRAVEATLGSGVKEVLPEERELAAFARRGLQATSAIDAGERLREGVNIEILRPGAQPLGLHPKHLPEIEGKAAARDIPLGHGIGKGDWRD